VPRHRRHCEKRKRRSNPVFFWIGSRRLSSAARCADPLVRNDENHGESAGATYKIQPEAVELFAAWIVIG
jgi:hypothetical protein